MANSYLSCKASIWPVGLSKALQRRLGVLVKYVMLDASCIQRTLWSHLLGARASYYEYVMNNHNTPENISVYLYK